MDDIAIPMLVGDLEDIVQQENTQSEGISSNTSQMYEREAR